MLLFPFHHIYWLVEIEDSSQKSLGSESSKKFGNVANQKEENITEVSVL